MTDDDRTRHQERVTTRVRCRECGRVFDLTDADDAGEYHYGHDCE